MNDSMNSVNNHRTIPEIFFTRRSPTCESKLQNAAGVPGLSVTWYISLLLTKQL